MKRLYAVAIIFLHTHFAMGQTPGGTQDEQILTLQAITAFQTQLNIASPNQNTRIVSCTCPVPPQAIPIPLPNLLITLQNYLGQTVNSFTFPTNPNFKSRIAILTVQLFPPSSTLVPTNIIGPNGAITTFPGIYILGVENSYALVYTLQSPDGLYFQKEIQYPTPTNRQTFLSISSGVPTVPTSITINTSPTLPAPLAKSTILPSLAGFPFLTQEQIVNTVSPITQKFLITTDAFGLNPTATPICGVYDPNGNLTTPVMTTAILPATSTVVPPITPTPVDTSPPLPPISITLYNGSTPYLITFQQQGAVQFTQEDILNGIIMHLYIYPPLYQNGITTNNFIFIATLQTLDGLKFQKIVNQSIPFTTLPLTFTITTTSLQGILTVFTSAIASPQVVQQTYNMISPINIRCRLQQDDNNTIIISLT